MRRPYIPMLAFALLLLIYLYVTSDIAVSVIPGWHVSIGPPEGLPGILVAVILGIVLFTYWALSRWTDRISTSLFVYHFLLSLPLVLYVKFVVWLLPGWQLHNDPATAQQQYNLISYLAFGAQVLFLAGQGIFGMYAFRTFRKWKNTLNNA